MLGLTLGWVAVATSYYIVQTKKKACPLDATKTEIALGSAVKAASLEDAFVLLKKREDKKAVAIFDQILKVQPDNIKALWGKAEVLRRSYEFKGAEKLLDEILKKDPANLSAINSLAYIRYKDDLLDESLKLVNQVLKCSPDKENEALAYMMLGTINSKRSSKGGFFSKIKYGTQIKGYFLKARDIDPDMPEVHLGLGTFYLKAPSIVGGDLDKAIQELEVAVKLAPEFATANARLAQAYKKKGDTEKFNYYYEKAKKLDPENETLRELK